MSADGPTVVSTTPSGTEICYALGVEPAAVSHQCDFPPAAAERPTITDSGDDEYHVDAALLAEIAPDVIVTQTVCGVCAVDEERVSAELGPSADPTIVPLDASDLGDVADCVREVGAAVGREERAATVVDQLRDCIAQVSAITGAAGRRPAVVVLEWLEPLRVAGNWVPDMIDAAGGTSPLADPGERSRKVAWERLRETDPDVIVVAPCSLDPEATLERADELRTRPGWDELSAVREGRVFALDGNVLSRWTPRLGGELERLAGLLHPDLLGGRPDARALG